MMKVKNPLYYHRKPIAAGFRHLARVYDSDVVEELRRRWNEDAHDTEVHDTIATIVEGLDPSVVDTRIRFLPNNLRTYPIKERVTYPGLMQHSYLGYYMTFRDFPEIEAYGRTQGDAYHDARAILKHVLDQLGSVPPIPSKRIERKEWMVMPLNPREWANQNQWFTKSASS